MRKIKVTSTTRKIDPEYVAKALGADPEKTFYSEESEQFKEAIRIAEYFRERNISNPFINSVYGHMKLYRRVSAKQYRALINAEERVRRYDDYDNDYDYDSPWNDVGFF